MEPTNIKLKLTEFSPYTKLSYTLVYILSVYRESSV